MKTLHDALTELGEAAKLYAEHLRDLHDQEQKVLAMKGQAAAARDQLIIAQKAVDDTLANIKQSAPDGTPWAEEAARNKKLPLPGEKKFCDYPKCTCPMDLKSDDACAIGLPRKHRPGG